MKKALSKHNMIYNFLKIMNKYFCIKSLAFSILSVCDDDDVLTSLTIDDHDKDAVYTPYTTS